MLQMIISELKRANILGFAQRLPAGVDDAALRFSGVKKQLKWANVLANKGYDNGRKHTLNKLDFIMFFH